MNQTKAALRLPGAKPGHTLTRPDLQPPPQQISPAHALRVQRASDDVRVSLHEHAADMELDWRAFEQHADCTVFQTFAWLSTWQRHIGQRQGTRPVTVVGRDAQGQMLFVLPLAVERRGPLTALTWWGSGNNDYNAPLLAPQLLQRISGQDFLALWQRILQRLQAKPRWRFDLVDFVRMPAAVGQQPNPFLGLSVSPHPDHAYLTELAGNWENFYASKRSPATRQRERSKRKRLNALGAIAFVTPAGANECARTLDALIAQKTRSFARMGARNIFERPGWAAFYRALASEPGASEMAHVSCLNVGQAAGAINLGLVFKGTYYHLLASHADGEMARFSPGAAHLQDLMRYAIARGCTAYDFTIGDESYKRDWSDTQAVLFDHVSAASAPGALLAFVLRLQRRSKRFVKQTPVVWNAFTRVRARLASLRVAGPAHLKERS